MSSFPDYDSIYRKNVPDSAEEDKVKKIVETTKASIIKILQEKRISAEVELVGSTSKGTNLKGGDIDIFIVFPQSFTRDEIVKHGLEIGHRVLSDAKEKYAEHPYVFGYLEGHKIDIVPCYRIKLGDRVKSAVDRSPLHTRWVIENIDDAMRKWVILLKVMLKSLGLYGSEIYRSGFSGYVCELLVIRFGNLENVLEFFASSNRNLTVSFGNNNVKDESPLIVVDPVDPSRNAAAAVSMENLSRFRVLSREYLIEKSERYFSRQETENVRIHERGTVYRIISLPKPDLMDDILIPQVQKMRKVIFSMSEAGGFHPIDTEILVTDRINILIELETCLRPGVIRHYGPPAYSTQTHNFLEMWKNREKLRGPFIIGDRIAVEIKQERDFESYIISAIKEKDIGAHLNRLKEEIRITNPGKSASKLKIVRKYLGRTVFND